MLTYILKSYDGKKTVFQKPINVSMIFSKDAPADSLTAVFAVSGKTFAVSKINVYENENIIFSGLVDEQTEKFTSDGLILEIKARSIAAILLDNEAAPQIYHSPSFSLLMERHFNRLGFYEYIGDDTANNSELHITKGMSEWQVLSKYCRFVLNVEPKITFDGVIDISGKNSDEVTYIDTSRKCISIIHKRLPKILISEIYARTYSAGGYEMYIPEEKSAELGIKRRRYVNSIDSEMHTVKSAFDLLEKCKRNYEEYITELEGCVICKIGSELIIDKINEKLRVKEVRYSLNSNGEKTKIYLEAES